VIEQLSAGKNGYGWKRVLDEGMPAASRLAFGAPPIGTTRERESDTSRNHLLPRSLHTGVYQLQ
jgi:hypothetical protein